MVKKEQLQNTRAAILQRRNGNFHQLAPVMSKPVMSKHVSVSQLPGLVPALADI